MSVFNVGASVTSGLSVYTKCCLSTADAGSEKEEDRRVFSSTLANTNLEAASRVLKELEDLTGLPPAGLLMKLVDGLYTPTTGDIMTSVEASTVCSVDPLPSVPRGGESPRETIWAPLATDVGVIPKVFDFAVRDNTYCIAMTDALMRALEAVVDQSAQQQASELILLAVDPYLAMVGGYEDEDEDEDDEEWCDEGVSEDEFDTDGDTDGDTEPDTEFESEGVSEDESDTDEVEHHPNRKRLLDTHGAPQYSVKIDDEGVVTTSNVSGLFTAMPGVPSMFVVSELPPWLEAVAAQFRDPARAPLVLCATMEDNRGQLPDVRRTVRGEMFGYIRGPIVVCLGGIGYIAATQELPAGMAAALVQAYNKEKEAVCRGL